MKYITDDDYQILVAAKALQDEFARAITIKSVCRHCGYQSMDIMPDTNSLCPMSQCEGSMCAPE